MLGCDNRATASISRRKRRTASALFSRSGRSAFRATTRPILRWRALKTVPMPPSPSLVVRRELEERPHPPPPQPTQQKKGTEEEGGGPHQKNVVSPEGAYPP